MTSLIIQVTLKQDHTSGNTFQLQRVAENSIAKVDSAQLAFLKPEKKEHPILLVT